MFLPYANLPAPQYSISAEDQSRDLREWYGCLDEEIWRQGTSPSHISVVNSPRQNLIHTVLQFENMEDGWSGAGTKAIPEETVRRIIEVAQSLQRLEDLPNPELTPNGNGTISLEWENSRGEVYIEFGKTKISGFARFDAGPTVYFGEINALPFSFFKEIRNQLYPSQESTSITFLGAGMNGYAPA